MIYLAIDTCVWLELLKTDFNQDNNHFNELLFWIEGEQIKFVTTENMLNEWNRNKISKKLEITLAFKERDRASSSLFSAPHPFDTIYKADKVEAALNKRIDRVDLLFSSGAVIAKESDQIYLEAANRSLKCIAPNHSKDSFRDTVNLLALKKHVIDNAYPQCLFSTINYKDFSENGSKKYDLHNQLIAEFKTANLEYCYFDNSKDNFSGKLFNVYLRPNLPSFSDHLKAERKKEEDKKLKEAKIEHEKLMESTDPEFVSNTEQIDRIVLSGKRTSLDEEILKLLFAKHPSYEKYFFRKLTENGVV